ncbi:medium-chain dehydrogenase/reductase like protein [Cytidiella melzeri]|nr:medium-chain dehydrogenase/reductase like protein [Cytidiella melzeri]
MSTQKALLVPEKLGRPVVQDIQVYTPGPGELLVEIKAVGLNPADWKFQTKEHAAVIKEYPAILGVDIAGVVKDVGEGVTAFGRGDKVLYQGNYVNRNAAFQQYTTVSTDIVSKLPSNLSFEEAATLPAAVTTAAYGLYSTRPSGGERGGAGLTPAWQEGGRGKYTGQPILVIGGSSAVGQAGKYLAVLATGAVELILLQFAKLSGFSPIITTASSHNVALVKSLGATHVIERDAPLAAAVKSITSEPIKLIYDAISEKDTQNVAYDVLAPGGTFVIVLQLAVEKSKIDKSKTIIDVYGSPHDPTQRELGMSLWANVARLVENGEIKPNNVEIVPNGLAGIPDALEKLKAGKVSATKLVVQPWQTG